MLDDPAEVFGACLERLTKSVNATAADALQSAKLLAMEQKPLVRAYINAEVRDQLIAGDVLAAQSWSVTAQQAIDQARSRVHLPDGRISAVLRYGGDLAGKQAHGTCVRFHGLPFASGRGCVDGGRDENGNSERGCLPAPPRARPGEHNALPD